MSDERQEEPIELEPIEELDESTANSRPTLDIEPEPPFLRNYRRSAFPIIMLDRSLALAWHNDSFAETFPSVTPGRSDLVTFFSESFPPATQRELYASLKSSEAGFSWRGEIEYAKPYRPKIIANLLVSPILPERFPAGSEVLPEAYLAVIDDVTDRHRELIRGTFRSLLEASLLKDNDTGRHVSRVNEYSRILAERLGETGRYPEIDFEFTDTISFVAAMHDVGKIGTPDDILNKEGPLSEWEWEVMREHTINGAYILSTYPAPMAKQIALFHHERWDGSGYPYGIAAEMIPLQARIVTHADVYDALRMKRSYKPAFSHERAVAEMRKGGGSHFDPAVLEVFLAQSDTMREVFERLGDEENERPRKPE